jgi:hypothetical protein
MQIALASGGNVGGAATPAPTTQNQTVTPAPTTQNQTVTPAPTTQNQTVTPAPTTVSEPQWWTRPEIIVPITVAIISSVIGPIAVSRYGKRHHSTDNPK